jgi:outer membrane immunogenic protein
MKRFLLATTGVLALGIVAAQAADLPRAMPTKAAPVYTPVPVYNWTGPYVGINGGGGWGHASEAFSGTSHTISGGLVGATLGYNWQIGQAVVGLEGDIDWSNIRGSAACGLTTCETRNHWLGTVRGRLGYAFDRFMPYVTGGLAVGDIDHTIDAVGSSRETKAGWTVGGGIEAALANNWTAKLEYLYVDLGSGASVAGSDTNFRTNIVRAGLNYRF